MSSLPDDNYSIKCHIYWNCPPISSEKGTGTRQSNEITNSEKSLVKSSKKWNSAVVGIQKDSGKHLISHNLVYSRDF